MNKDWSEKNKKMQSLIGSKKNFAEGIDLLIDLRDDLFSQIMYIVNTYPCEAFYQMPFAGADGYHSKTLVYSMWHIFRIEDIVAHTLISCDEQVLFEGDWQKRTGSSIVTTGNELKGEEIAEFSKKLDVKSVFEYCRSVMDSTNDLLRSLKFEDLKRRFSEEDKNRVKGSHCVSSDEDAVWLIDYWCGKDVCGLIKMPFSRHWIMHIEAMCRICNKLCRKARKGVDPIARCGLSCNHCFLMDWCGGCRSAYNTCSDACRYPGKICPNTTCCMEKGLDGCYDCDSLKECKKGFYEYDDVNAIKAMALFIRKYGKKELLKTMDQLRREKNFDKVQEVLGDDLEKALKILEKTAGR